MITKGKWRITLPDANGLVHIHGERFIAQSVRPDDAQLIALSPKMAKLLENLCAEFEDYGKIDDSFYCAAKDILAKVE